MSSNAFDVQIPATEVQIAEAIRLSDPDTADTIRRLAFERDKLVGILRRIRGKLEEMEPADDTFETRGLILDIKMALNSRSAPESGEPS